MSRFSLSFAELLGRPARLPQTSRGALLTATDVHVELGGKHILRGVSLSIEAREVVALVGPNGAGKSTLLGALAGDITMSSGEVQVDSAPLESWSPIELSMRRAVMLQQSRVTFPYSVREVVAMGRAPWFGTDAEDQDDAIVEAALAETDMVSFADRRFSTLSGGEQARASLARCLAQQARLIMLDEPTAALDIHHQEEILTIARARAAAGDGVVIVMHDLALAAAHADRVVVMADGLIVGSGTPHEVLNETLLSEVYRHDLEVITHPRTGDPIVIPRR